MLTLWHPTRKLARRSRGFGDLFDEMFDATWPAFHTAEEHLAPAVNLKETDAGFELSADLPGVDEKDINVEMSDGVLKISAKRESDNEVNGNGHYVRERRYGTYSRSFRLGSSVDSEGIKASYDKGVLKVVLPKREEAKPRQIPVAAS